MRNTLEKSGSLGAVIAAAACPICFPKLALVGAFFGLGALVQYETWFFYAAHVLVILALAGHIKSYQRHKNHILLGIVTFSVLLFFFSLYIYVSEGLSYLALFGLIVTTLWQIYENRLSNRRCTQCDN